MHNYQMNAPVFTMENTEGFKQAQLDVLNEAFETLWYDFTDENGELLPDIDERELEKTLSDRIGNAVTGDPEIDTLANILVGVRHA